MAQAAHDGKPFVGFDDIFNALAGQVQLAAKGIPREDFVRYCGIDPDALRQAAKEAADEEFEHQHGMGPLTVARLRGLSASQRKAAHDALVETFELAFRCGFLLATVRAGLDDPTDGLHGTQRETADGD